MTEREWLTANDPTPMLGFLRSKTSDRKLRLFAVASCRRFWHLLDDKYGRPAVEAAERCAEGMLSVDELWAMGKKDDLAFNYDLHEHIAQKAGVDDSGAVSAAFYAVGLTMGLMGWQQATSAAEAAASTAGRLGLGSKADEFAYEEQEAYDQAARPFTTVEKVIQIALLRDIFANPFRPVDISPAWLIWNDGTVRKIAQTIYDDRAFDRLPMLADALEEAGCTSADILNHCRQPGVHVRGCWVIDILLGKE